ASARRCGSSGARSVPRSPAHAPLLASSRSPGRDHHYERGARVGRRAARRSRRDHAAGGAGPRVRQRAQPSADDPHRQAQAVRAADRGAGRPALAFPTRRGTGGELTMATITKRPGRSKYYYRVRFANGVWSTWRAGFTDKRATESKAEQAQAQIDRGATGL